MNLFEVQSLALNLMVQHDLVFWRFQFDKAVKRFGLCSYRRRTITVSAKLASLNEEAIVRNVLLHEIAHAIVGPGQGHGYRWKHTARKIGCDAKRCYSAKDVVVPVVAPRVKYRAMCPKCGREYTFARMPRREKACGVCCNQYNHGKFSRDYTLTLVPSR